MGGHISSSKKERTVEDDVYFEEIRKHILQVSQALGQALYSTFNTEIQTSLEGVLGCWRDLGNSICDFGEFLDD